MNLSAKWQTMSMLITVMMLTACGEKPAQPPTPQSAPAHPFQQQQSVLDKSRGVGQNQQKDNEELRQNVEQQTQ
ncbi:MAG: hypothetical protein Q7S51_02330 [Gallionellaceae bacterium]|nr:hypothetical protein [Gallionellaceae bacterium]